MKLNWIIMVLFCAILTGPNASGQQRENTRLFLDGLTAYADGDYTRSINAFERIADAGVRNGKLYYNLGNAYFRAGDSGRAILWYERALKLIPDDPDLKFNLEYARSYLKDEQPEDVAAIWRVLFFWKFMLSPAMVVRIAVILNLVLWSIIFFRVIRGRNILNIRVAVAAVLAAVFVLTACYNFYEVAHVRTAVILPEKLSVRSGLSNDASELFVLHAGTRVRIDEERNGFYRIQYTEGKIGWVSGEALGLI